MNAAFVLVTFTTLLFTCIRPEAVFDNWTNFMESAIRLQTGATPGRRCQPPHPRESGSTRLSTNCGGFTQRSAAFQHFIRR